MKVSFSGKIISAIAFVFLGYSQYEVETPQFLFETSRFVKISVSATGTKHYE